MSGFSALDVIREVKIRPGVYDRKSLEPPRWEHRQQLWLEVAESVTAPEEWENFSQDEKETRVSEVTNKWKNLRDHFYREVKLIESGNSNKKRKYIYYDEMEFVRPYIGYKLAPKNKRQREVIDSSNDDFKVNDSDIDMDAFLKLHDDEDKDLSKNESLRRTFSSNDSAKKYKVTKPNVIKRKSILASERGEIKNFELLQKKDDIKNPTFKIRESDISFCLSLVQHLRELTGARKLSAKIDILKVLHKNIDEIEQGVEISKPELFHGTEEMGEYSDDPLRAKKQHRGRPY